MHEPLDPFQFADLMRLLIGGAAPVRVLLDVRPGRPAFVYAALVVRPDTVDPLIALMHDMPVGVMTGGAAVPAADLGGEREAVVALLAEMEDDAGVMEQSGDKRGQTVRGYAGRLRAALGMKPRGVWEDA
jgi:hypothetical protein